MSRFFKLAVPAVLITLSACGGGTAEVASQTDGEASAAPRVVQVEMVDHSFSAPALGEVTVGETITFEFVNKGTVDHEAFIGDAAEQLAYAEEMEKVAAAHAGDSAHGDDGHDDHPEGSLHLAPGESGKVTYTFEEAEEIEIACYEPGHYEAGMRLTIAAA